MISLAAFPLQFITQKIPLQFLGGKISLQLLAGKLTLQFLAWKLPFPKLHIVDIHCPQVHQSDTPDSTLLWIT